ncbi:MAG TPA: DUF3857 and transglutaminase domain-containing protein [Blastocatellia bacterium]|nr:DUF3857 and transglutaminase domain-containing protein [Blastocatellia bacterium]
MRFILPFAFILLAATPAPARQDVWKTWKPVDQSLLALKSPVVEKDADAEAIFWEVQVEPKDDKAIFTNYIRIKIFTDRGKESRSTVEIPYAGKDKIENIVGRTIKADGAIVDLKSDTILERTVVKTGDIKVRVISFVFPAVEAGAIIEYRWREVRNDMFFLHLELQLDIPVQSLKYSIKSQSDSVFTPRVKTFNGQAIFFTKEKDNYFSTTMTNVPAYREEPFMPPAAQVRRWMLVYQLPDLMSFNLNTVYHEIFKSLLNVNDDVQKTATAIVADATTPEQKLDRLLDFCRTKIKNIYSETPETFASNQAKIKENKSSSDVLKRRTGTGLDINLLFCALARAVGFDARVALVADRSQFFFDPKTEDALLGAYFMRTHKIAVRASDRWRFFDPGNKYLPTGMLRWQEEGQNAMILGRFSETYQFTPMSPPERSLQKRTAKLRLSEDGTLEGDVSIEYSGHFATGKRETNEKASPQEHEKMLRDMLKEQMSTAELSNIRVENLTESSKPLIYSFHVRVPGYAQRTGRRLILQLAFFQRGLSPRFTSSQRNHSIYFHFPWLEDDDVTIDLPVGFALDNADGPASFNASTVCKYEVKTLVTDDKRTLIYKRRFLFGAGGVIFFPSEAYQQLKSVFDTLHSRDNHSIALKQSQ